MTLGTVLALVLAAAVAAFVLAPLFRSDASQKERHATRQSDEQDLVSEREMALGALRDLEDDRATGKLDEPDYQAAKSELTARAVGLLKRLDEVEAKRSAPRPEPVPPPSDRAV